MRFSLNPITFYLLCIFSPLTYAGVNDEVRLQLEQTFTSSKDNPAGENLEETPIFITAQSIEGKKNGRIEASGDVELRKHGQAIHADHMSYHQESKDVSAEGAVRVEQDNNAIQSPRLTYNLETNIGDMPQPVFEFGDNHARGKADSLHLASRQNYILRDVTYTTCPAEHDDWLLKVRELEIDRNDQLGVAHGARVEFMGVPILYTPWMDFSLNNQRKSGFLGPVLGSTVKGGSDLTLPYYWNIAPNLDATLAPRILSKRGILLNNEVRYLEPAYSGEAHLDVLPGDRLTGSTRSLLAINHNQSFGHGLSGSVNFSSVSDDAYFRDLSDAVVGTSQTNLLREGLLTYSNGWWNAATRMQSFQTLQDPAAPVVEPYRRLPQISINAQRVLNKANLTFAGEFVDFRHPTLVNSQRLVLYPSVSYPLIAQPAFYLTPKLGLHNTYYSMGQNNVDALPNTSRSVPIFSLDSGMTMERNFQMAGNAYLQTLEPRAYYVFIPYVNQNQLPNFDSAQADFSFAQMFTENRIFGSDRIGDANQITLALTSRLLQEENGAERLRLAIGQRFSANTPEVNLVAPTATTNKSDILLAASGQVSRAWSLDSTFQFNPNQSRSEKFSASARYQPETGKVLNLGYRFTRDSLRQMDLSAQWPLSGHWHGVARWNYSFQDGRILEALGGLEYNQRCWAVRLVAQRFATATQQVSTGIFVQLELNDLVAVGADPLSLLRMSVPGYSKMNDHSRDNPAEALQ
jgi:LPS-assembly protein